MRFENGSTLSLSMSAATKAFLRSHIVYRWLVQRNEQYLVSPANLAHNRSLEAFRGAHNFFIPRLPVDGDYRVSLFRACVYKHAVQAENTFYLIEHPHMQNATIREFADLEPDILILTATVIERDSVLSAMRPLKDFSDIIKIAHGPDTFYLGRMGCHSVVHTMCGMGTIGRDGSSLTVSDAIRIWNPRAIIAVGIAFGIDPNKQEIGDVLVSKTVSAYEPQRVQDDLIISRGVIAESGLHLFNRFINVEGWEFQRPDGSLVKLRAGQLLSGDKLVDSSKFKRQLLVQYPEAIGGEMEGAGLYAAAERAKVEWIIVKGICDWADGSKDKQHQRLAAAAAVSLVEHVLKDENAIADLRRPRQAAISDSAQLTRTTASPALFQLPSPVKDFVGREAETAMLLKVLQPSQRSTVASINGLPGVGKSELAILVANQLRSSYPDAQLFIRMCGIDDSPRAPQDVLASCIRALTGRDVESTTGLDQLINQYRSCLAQKRAIIVLDNVVDAAQANPLLPPIGSALLITSRNSLSLSPLTRLFLDELRPQEAKDLFCSIVPLAPSDVVEEISALCGYLPLALRAAATLLGVRIDLDPNKFLEMLKRERTRLEQLSSEEANVLSVNASFNLSYQNLSSELAHVLRQLTVFVEWFDAEAEEFICTDPDHQALSGLVKRSLIGFDELTKRYYLHDLFRLFARNQISEGESWDHEQRHAIYYGELLKRANSLSLQGGSFWQQGLDLFDRDRGNITAAFAWARDHAHENEQAAALCLRYPNDGRYILDLRQNLGDRISSLKNALVIGAKTDRHQLAAMKNSLGWALARLKNVEEAVPTLEQALALARELGDRQEEGLALDTLGWCYAEIDELNRAVTYHNEALAIAKDTENLRLQCRALNNLGWAHVGLGDITRGIAFHQEALAIARELGDSYEEGVITRYLARATAEQKEIQQAIDLYETGLMIFRDIGSKRDQWSILDSLGDIYKDQGEILRAIEYYEHGLEVARQDNDLAAQSTALNNLGRAYYAQSDYQRALDFHSQDLELCRKLDNRRREATVFENLGDCYWKIEDYPRALEHYLKRLRLQRQLNNQEEEHRALLDLGNLSLYFKEVDRALDYYAEALGLARELEDETGQAWSLYNFGRAHARLRQVAADFYERSLVIFRAANDLAGQVQALLRLGELFLNAQQFDRPIEPLQTVLTLASENPDKVDVAYEIKALVYLGSAYCQQENLTKGIPRFHDALKKIEQSGNREMKSLALTYLGFFHRSSKPDLAISYVEKSLNEAIEYGDKLEEYRAQVLLGNLVQDTDPTRALSYLEPVLAAGEEAKPILSGPKVNFPLWQAKLLMQIATLQHKSGNSSSSLANIERATPIFQEFNERQKQGELLRLAGSCYSELRNEERAVECFEQAIPIFRETNNPAYEVECHLRVSYAYSKLDDVSKVKRSCETALALLETVDNRKLELLTLLLLGGANNKSGNLEEAEGCFEKALLLSRHLERTNDPFTSEPLALIEMGSSYLAIGQAKRSIEISKKALALARKRANKYLEGGALYNLGRAYIHLDQRRRAIEFYRKAVAAFAESKKVREQCNVLLKLGDALRGINEITSSLDSYREILELARGAGDRYWERTALAAIGNAYRANGELDQAIEFHEKALQLAVQVSDRLGEGDTLLMLGKDFNELSEHERAIDLQEKALLIFNELRSRSDEAQCLHILGDSYREIGQFARAIRLHEEALSRVREYSDKDSEVWLLGSLAEDRLKAGNLKESEEISGIQLELSQELGDQCRQANAEFCLAQITYANGDKSSALKLARGALKIMQRIESTDAQKILEKINEWREKLWV